MWLNFFHSMYAFSKRAPVFDRYNSRPWVCRSRSGAHIPHIVFGPVEQTNTQNMKGA